MKTIPTLVFGLALLSGQASAANIGWEAAPTTIAINDTFTLDILGSGFVSDVDGGGVNIAYDSSILNVVSVSIDQTVWNFGPTGIDVGTIDNIFGTVDGIMVNRSDVQTTLTGNFTVASIMFTAVGNGTSTLGLTEYLLNPWASGGTLINPAMASGSVTVGAAVVPIPAAAWLFGSGLLFFAGISGKKKAV